MIQDSELREIYKTSSEEHLQLIEAGLLNLEKNPDDETSLEELLRELHSLKGDSRIVEVESVENLAHSLEDVLGCVKRHELEVTPEVSDRLYEALDAINQIVVEATTGFPCLVDADSIIDKLRQLSDGNAVHEETSPATPSINSQLIYIEDDELREIYKVSSEEHLQNLESGILYLENHPDDHEKMNDLLRELHSLKGDSRIVGVESVEILSHTLEDILKSIQENQTQLTVELGDRIYQALDGISKIVEETVTGVASGVDPNEVLRILQVKDKKNETTEYLSCPVEIILDPKDLPETAAEIESREIMLDFQSENQEKTAIVPETENKPTKTVSKSSKSSLQKQKATAQGSIGEPYKIDTIRVQTRLLDALMTQTGELTVTKIRIAHFASLSEQLVNQWENWQSILNQKRFVKSESYRTEDNDYVAKIEQLINQLLNAAQDNSTRLDLISEELEEKIRTLRLLPLSNVFQFFPRLVRDLSKQEGKEIELIIEGGETVADKKILEEIKDPLMHIIRNCVDHGLETTAERQKAGKTPIGKIFLRAYQTATNIIIEVQDDGKGLDVQKIKETALRKGLYRTEELATMSNSQIQSLIFEAGFSTRTFITEVSGRGVGLDIVRTNVERLKGNIEIESIPGVGCTFRLQLGTTLATANVLLVKTKEITHAIPIEFVQTTLLIAPEEIFTIEGRQTIALEGQAVSVAPLSELLELSTVLFNEKEKDKKQRFSEIPCVLIKIGEEKFGLFVDEVIDTQDVVIKPQSQLLKRVRNVTGATILGTGEVCMILNPQDLLKSVQKHHDSLKVDDKITLKSKKAQSTVLLAEDSIATRTQEKRILENAGFEVITAVDGLDAWNKLKTREFDAIISDIQMPNLDGLGFTERIRKDSKYNNLPIILVTSLASDEDKRKGAEAGANAYIVKGKFNQEILIDTLNRLV